MAHDGLAGEAVEGLGARVVELAEEALDVERQRRQARVDLALPDLARAIPVDLDPMAVGVVEVQRLADEVIGEAGERDAVARGVRQPAREVGALLEQQREVVEPRVAEGRPRRPAPRRARAARARRRRARPGPHPTRARSARRRCGSTPASARGRTPSGAPRPSSPAARSRRAPARRSLPSPRGRAGSSRFSGVAGTRRARREAPEDARERLDLLLVELIEERRLHGGEVRRLRRCARARGRRR